MNRLIAYLMLPVLLIASTFTGIATAANITLTVSGSLASGAVNALTLDLTLPNTVSVGDDLTITTRNQDGSPLALIGGAVTVDGAAMNAVASGSGSVTIGATQALSGSFTITGLTVTNPANAEHISVIVSTQAGDVGATVLPIAGANAVQVTAYVGSTLSMTLSGSTINLGVIPVDAVIASLGLTVPQSTTVSVTTNAANGYTLNAQTASVGVNEPNRLVNFAQHVFTELQAGREGFAIRVATTDATVLNTPSHIGAGLTGNAMISATDARGLVESSTSALNHQTVIEYGATVGVDTAQGMYTETVLYSVTANF